uniref:beta-galactosidase trimerization domain-containing protein n=1 Tax=Vallitalea guaymasensis TaxID=1185412 RepID=UPI00272B37EF
ELAKGLDKYVSQGGTLIGTARCGMLGQYGWYNHKIPCFDLSDVFGVEAIEVEAGINSNVSYDMKKYTGYWHKEVLQINDKNVDILARFNDDKPAVTINDYGKGQAVYFATHPDVAYLEEKSYLLWDIIDDILLPKGLSPKISVDYTNRSVKEIDVHYLSNEKEEYLIITNYVNKKHSGFFINGEKYVRISMKTNRQYYKAIDIMTEETIDIQKDEDCILLETKIIKDQVKIIKLT